MANSTSHFLNVVFLASSRLYVGLAFALATPFYIKVFGSEAYGLIGFYQLLRLFILIFDPGIGTALNKQLAKQAGGLSSLRDSHDTLRTVEIVTWTVSLLFGLSFTALSGMLSKHWFISQAFSASDLHLILMWMGIATASVWPSMIYGQGLQGLHQQRAEGFIQVTAVSLQHLGALVFIYFCDLGIVSYFTWQAGVNFLQSLALRTRLLSYLPKFPTKPRFSLRTISSQKQFLAGMSLVFITSFTLSHYDRLFLSAYCSLEIYGAYCLAVVLANIMGCYCHGVHTTFFPRFTLLFERKATEALIKEYRLAYELMALGIIPGAVALFLYAPLFISLLSTGDPKFNQQVLSFFRPLLIGSSLFFIVHVPIIMQYANSWSGLFGKFNLFASFALIPISLLCAQKWAGHATAVAWAILGIAYVCIKVPLMHTKILQGELWRWYLYALLIPLMTSALFFSASYYFIGGWSGLILGGILSLVATLSLLPNVKTSMYDWISSQRQNIPEKQ